jgi:phosphonate transport system substrate-binding protein
MIRSFIVIGCVVLALANDAAAAVPRVLNFGVVPTESSHTLRKDYEAMRIAFKRAVGIPVKMFFAPDYTGVIEAMRFEQVHLALLGNNSAIDAVDRASAEVFAQTVDKDGNPGYWTFIIVHRDSPIRTLSDLLARRGELTLAMGDHQSTSGTLVPGHYAFALNGVNPQKEFKAFRNAHHEANILAVANRQIDAATCSNETFFRLEQARPEFTQRVRIIWKGPVIASDPLAWRTDLPSELKQKIADFFAGYGDTPEERASIAALKWSGFRPSTNAQLNPYRLLRVLKEKASVEADETMRAEEKAAKLAEIAAQQAGLERAMSPENAPARASHE